MKKSLSLIFLFLAFNLTVVEAQKISALPAVVTQTDSDIVPCVQSSITKKTTFAKIKIWIKSWITKSDVGLSNVDNTSDVNKPVSTAQAAYSNAINVSYKTIMQCSGYLIAGMSADTFIFGVNSPLIAIDSGVSVIPQVIYIDSLDYPSINGVDSKLRIRAQLFVNNSESSGDYTIGLYPITRPASSGGTGVNIYTLGDVVSGSDGISFSDPIINSTLSYSSSDFSIPENGFYVIGIITSAPIETNSFISINAQLQIHND